MYTISGRNLEMVFGNRKINMKRGVGGPDEEMEEEQSKYAGGVRGMYFFRGHFSTLLFFIV